MSFKVYKRKIDIYVARDGRFQYVCSTNASKTCKDAKSKFLAKNPSIPSDNIKAVFAPLMILNIGMDTNDGRGITIAQINAALRLANARAVAAAVRRSDSEPTYVVELSDALTEGSVFALAEILEQDAIAVWDMVSETGKLIGPKAASWGAFDPERFLLVSGARLADALTVLDAMSPRDSSPERDRQ